jgi:hypothetical protein
VVLLLGIEIPSFLCVLNFYNQRFYFRWIEWPAAFEANALIDPSKPTRRLPHSNESANSNGVIVVCVCVCALRRPSSPDHFDRIIKRDCIRENVVNNIITSWFYFRLSCVYFIKSILWTYNNTDRCWARVVVFFENEYCFRNIKFVFIMELIRVFSVWPAVK